MNNRLLQSLTVLAIFTIGLVIGSAVGRDSTTATHVAPAVKPAERKPLYYRNPMNPEITSRVPAKDEMGMDYVPVYADDAAERVPGTVTIDPVTIQSIGVRTAQVRRESLSHVTHAPGRIDYDEATINRLHPKVDGWIETLVADETGRHVGKGDVLLRIYSPNLVTSEEEYLLTLEHEDSAMATKSGDALRQARQIADAARQRLILLDVPEKSIRALESTRKVQRTMDVLSPFDGTITKIGARQGQYITPATELFTIADLSRVWVTVDVYEQDLPWIRTGDVASMEVMAVPGTRFSGAIAYIYPYMEPKTRTAKVRLEFSNSDGALMPAMFANVDIRSSVRSDAIVVPSESIVRSGLQDQVFIAKPGGKFEPRKVTTGVDSNGLTQIVAGLSPGETVVTSAQFLIDSESKLNEATARMLEATSADSDKVDRGKDGAPMESMP